jgi:hypothetical protein
MLRVLLCRAAVHTASVCGWECWYLSLHLHYKHMQSVWHTVQQGVGESYLELASLALVSVMHMRLQHMLSVSPTRHQRVGESHTWEWHHLRWYLSCTCAFIIC